MPGTPASRPNVLLIVLDTARADAFEPYGAGPGASPALTQLAARGVAVEHAYAPAPWTVPSHAAMFTGQLPRTSQVGRGAFGTPHGMVEALSKLDDVLLPRILAAQGYATAGVSTNAWVSPGTGFDRGFDQFQLLETDRLTGMAGTSPRERAAWAWQSLRAQVDDGAVAVERLLGEWLAQRGTQPFFWFVNLVECHSPYLPPRPYNDLGAVDRWRAGEEARRFETYHAFNRACLAGEEVPPPALGRMRHLYGRAVRLLDDWLARVIDGLDRAGILDETIVVVTSDHGENFGENKLMGHAFSLDHRLIRVPFVVLGPALPKRDQVVSLADVPAFLADAIGLDDHPWGPPGTRDVAVAQLDAPCAPDDPFALEALQMHGLDTTSLPMLVRSFSCATDGRLKLFRDGEGETIVDLDEDPLELAPVPLGRAHHLQHGDALTRLRAGLDEAAAVEQAPSWAQGPLSVDDPKLEAQLKLLGYL